MSTPEIRALLEKASESIDAANDLLKRGFFGFAAARAYYAMFYCAQALLMSRGKSYSRHSAVIAGFGREFVKTGMLDPKLHRYIREAFDARQVGDYEPIQKLSKPTAERTLMRAKELFEVIRAFLQEGQRS